MLTVLELTFMGLTRSNCGLFRAPVLIFSPVGKRERRCGGGRMEGGKKGIEKERKEGRRNKKRLEER